MSQCFPQVDLALHPAPGNRNSVSDGEADFGRQI
jgi:hypothetical protein